MKSSDFQSGRPLFEPEKFFSGRTQSTGVVESRRGKPRERVATETKGTWEGDTLHIQQELVFGDTRRSHRTWAIRRIDAHRYEATANDIIGTARGTASGDTFHWKFTLATKPGNPLFNVVMSQWMYLQPDRRTMINHTTISKAGIVIAQVTEQFRKVE